MSSDVVWMPGGVRTEICLGSEETAGAFCLLVDHPPAGWSLPAHRHRREAETIHILDGEFEMDIAGQSARLEPGQTVHIPAGVPHAGANIGAGAGRRVVLFTPGGLEHFFRETGAASATAPVDLQAALNSALRHGWEFTATAGDEPLASPAAGEITIRAARHGEANEILAVWSAAYARTFAGEAQRAAVDRLTATAAGPYLLVAEHDRRMVGTVIAAWDGWRGNLYRLAVSPSHRGQGIARLLVQAAERQLQSRGARRLSALVSRDNMPALALWSAAGYHDEPHTGRFVKDL